MEAIAPFSDKPFQNKDKMITGQKVAAMPDQPNMITQNTCRSGETIAMIMAMANARMAIMTVTIRERRVKSLSLISG